MQLKARGTMLVVEVEGTPEKSGGFVVCDDKPVYTRGKVVSAGVETFDKPGDLVIFLTEKGRIVGLGFPPALVIVDEEDVHAKVVEE